MENVLYYLVMHAESVVESLANGTSVVWRLSRDSDSEWKMCWTL